MFVKIACLVVMFFFFLAIIVSENTKKVLVECASSHLRHKNFASSYGARLASSSARILLQSVPGYF